MASSDIIKIGFDYRSSLEQFEKDTNGVFDGISNKAGKQKITIQLDAKDDKIIDKIKELQKFKLDKFTFEFGNSGLEEQLQTFDKLENKINEIIDLSRNNLSSTFKEIKKAASLDGLSYGTDEYNDELKKVTSSIVEMGKKGQESTREYFIEVQKLLNLYELFRKTAENSGLFNKNTPQADKFSAFIRNSQLANDLEPIKDTTSDIFNGCLAVIDNFIDASTGRFISLKDSIEKVITISEGLKSINNTDEITVPDPLSNDVKIEELKSDIVQVKAELSEVKEKISGIDTEGFENVRNDVEKTKESVKELNNELVDMKTNLSSTSTETNISKDMKDAFPSTEATASVEKTTQAIKEENNALEETVNKAKQAVSELVKGRDVVSQNWYREKGTVVGKDSKGNDITRDADEFSFVERLKNGQLQTVLATYNEETGKWAEQVINVRTAFEQVEKAIISADNKIASLEMTKEKTLAAHSGYDTTADDNQIAIERKKRDELQNTLNLYGQEKEYVFEIEAANKRIADNQERLNNKKQSQTNLRQVVSDEQFLKDWDAAIAENNKRDAESAKQASKELNEAWNSAIKVNNALDETKSTLSSLSKMPELTSNFSDMKSKISSLNSDLISGKIILSEYKNEVKSVTSEYSKMVSIQQKRNVEDYNANAKANLENAKNIQSEWDKNIKAIQDYMDAMTKLNNLKAKDKGTGSEANQIALQTQNVEELKQAAFEARQNLSSMQAENPDIIAWKQWVDMMELFNQASKGSAESAAKLKDVLDNIKVPSLDKYENKLASYQTKKAGYDATIARFNDGGWTSDEYLKNVQAVENAVKKYEDLLSNIKAKGGIASEEDVQKLKEYESEIKKTISTVTNMSAAEKGYNFVSAQKELDKIHKLLNENSKMSSEAKVKIQAYYREIESGNPSMSLDRIHGEIMKIYNAEVEAGRAGRSFFDTLKNSGFHQLAAQMAGMFGFYDVINVIKQVVSTVTELNTQITELAKVSEQSSKQIYADFDSYADIAKEIRGTISDTIAATADWSKNGYSIPDAKQLAEISQLYKNVGDGIDIDTANESLISTLKGFQLEADQAEHIVDVFNEVSNNESISSGGIGEALQRSAASFNAASTSLEKSVSLVTATNSVLQDPEKVGNMWRTVSARLRGSETELKEMGEDTDGLVTSTSKLQALVKGITGFDIMKDKDTYKDIYDIVLGIGEKWQDLSDIDRASLLEALAGKQQSNALAAALSNIDILKKSYEEATNAEGSARKENEEYSKSIQASIDLAQAKLEQLANDTLNSNFLKGAIDAGGKLIEVLDGIVKSGNTIPTLLAAIGAGLSFKNVGEWNYISKFHSNNIICFIV